MEFNPFRLLFGFLSRGTIHVEASLGEKTKRIYKVVYYKRWESLLGVLKGKRGDVSELY